VPTVKLDRKVFENLVGKKLSENELKERIAMIGTDLESVNDKEIIVEVFPDRPDMLSEQGFGRAFKSFLGLNTGLAKYDIKKSGYKVIVDKSVTMRPYTVCAIVKELKFNDEKIREVMQVQEKLATTHGRNRRKSAYGIYPLKSINFPVTYIAKDPAKVMFRPLGFERKIPASQVEELHPTGKKYKHLAEDWKKYPFFIDATENVMCMLPYTNSNDTGKVELDTTEVFIECTGVDLKNVQVALNIIVTMFADMGGEIYSIEMDYSDKKINSPDFTPRKMELDLEYVNKRLGLELKEKEVHDLLKRMGYGIDGAKVLVPAYRADVMHQCDLAEDIAIAFGYENFEEEIPEVATIAQENRFEVFKGRLSAVLVGLGMMEVSNYHLIDKVVQTKKILNEMEVLEILDPVSEGYNSLRSWILPCLMQTLQINKNNEYPQKMFEIGNVFKKDLDKEALADEFVRLGVVMAHQNPSYTEIMQVLDYIMRMLDLKYEVVEEHLGCFLPGRCGRVVVNGVKIAYVGEMHPQVLGNFELEMPVAGFELNVTEIWNLIKD